MAVAAGSADRLATGTPDVQGLPALVSSGIAAAVMVAGALLLGSGCARLVTTAGRR